MNKESLEKIREEIFKIKENKHINEIDKMELLMNIDLFLQNYEDNIKILNKYGKKRKKWTMKY